MDKIEKILRIMLLILACIMMLVYLFTSEPISRTELLIFSFGLAIFAKVSAIE